MRCLDRDPSRLRQVADMIADLGRTDDGKALLPEDLDSIWKPIWTVAEHELEAPAREASRDKLNLTRER